MYRYSRKSLEKLDQAHPLLQILFNKAIEKYDITITCAYRGEERQNEYAERGVSKLRYPDSKHNKQPSLAVDFAVYRKVGGVSFNEEDCLLVAGFIEGLAHAYGIPVRLGARWSHQWVSENTFRDFYHIELCL